MPEAGYTEHRALAALLEALDEGALVFDDLGVCRAVGRRVTELFGVEAAAIVGLGRDAALTALAAGLQTPGALAPLATGAVSTERTVVDPIEVSRPHARTVVWTSIPIADGGGRLDVVRDVTRERRAETAVEDLERRLELESTLDDLTGLTNRRRFEEDCGREHRRAQREWVSYVVARVDVDGMGALNEKLGAAAGDELLRRLGEALRVARREYDVVARWKDDEFILLLPRADAVAIGRVLRRAIDATHEMGGALVPGMSVSVGAAIWGPPSAEGPTDVIRRAGDALARARARGPGKLEIDAGTSDWQGDMG
jgi:diguanylate cyclase (GGDEF)-like protein